jgi:gluconate 5-dehydrogenase
MTDDRLFDVRGRRALVTGASRGIGYALARGLLDAGCTVVVNARDEGRLTAARDELAGDSGGEVHAVAFDVTDPEQVTAGVRRAGALAGPLDILVNNAGMQYRAALHEFPDDVWQRLLATNVTSAYLVGRAVAAGMMDRGHGKIVNVCSLQSELARPGIAPYAATKGALKMLTKGMCADWARYGIQVNGIGPGYIETELTAALRADPQFDAWVRTRTPAGRWGTPADLVGALRYLVAPASDFVNGQIIYVDGGMLAVV